MSEPGMDDMDSRDPRLAAGFAELYRQSAEPARPEAVAAARRAMHMATAERAARRGVALLLDRARQALTLHRVVAGAAGATVGLATITALGWNAPVGAPLHAVEVAHEQIALALPGIDRASLDLSYAEARLAQAAGGESAGDALDEAQRLLDDAHSHLPGDHGAAVWNRWQSDSRRLDDLRAQGGRGGDDHGAVPPAGGSTSPGSGGRSGDDGRGGTTTSTTTSSTSASRSGDDGRGGGGSSSSTTTQSESRGSSSSSSTSSGGGGHDGGSSSSSSTSTSTSGGGSDH